MNAAQHKELDQLILNSVCAMAKRACIPLSRIMAMRWILTLKEVEPDGEYPEGRKSKTRLVAKGFTDPDLTTIRDEAPTLSKVGRHLSRQLAACEK